MAKTYGPLVFDYTLPGLLYTATDYWDQAAQVGSSETGPSADFGAMDGDYLYATFALVPDLAQSGVPGKARLLGISLTVHAAVPAGDDSGVTIIFEFVNNGSIVATGTGTFIGGGGDAQVSDYFPVSTYLGKRTLDELYAVPSAAPHIRLNLSGYVFDGSQPATMSLYYADATFVVELPDGGIASLGGPLALCVQYP